MDKALIRQRKLAGVLTRDIAVELGVSTRTIIRYTNKIIPREVHAVVMPSEDEIRREVADRRYTEALDESGMIGIMVDLIRNSFSDLQEASIQARLLTNQGERVMALIAVAKATERVVTGVANMPIPQVAMLIGKGMDAEDTALELQNLVGVSRIADGESASPKA